MNKRAIESYTKTLEAYGDDPRAVQWGSRETQYFRFKILADIAQGYSDDCVILDYGCGTGDLFFYLLFTGYRGKYIGVDINPSLIALAKKKYTKYPQARFITVGSVKDVKKFKYDYAFVSGVFNDPVAKSERMLEDTVAELYRRAERGVAFNALSSAAKSKGSGAAYFDPFDTARFCLEKVSPFVTLRHDYRGGNFTVYLYKQKAVSF